MTAHLYRSAMHHLATNMGPAFAALSSAIDEIESAKAGTKADFDAKVGTLRSTVAALGNGIQAMTQYAAEMSGMPIVAPSPVVGVATDDAAGTQAKARVGRAGVVESA